MKKAKEYFILMRVDGLQPGEIVEGQWDKKITKFLLKEGYIEEYVEAVEEVEDGPEGD